MLSKRKDSDGWMYNKCEIEGWNNFQFYTLTPNGTKLWQKCSLIYYSGGSLVRIGDPNEVKQHIKIFQKYLDQIRAEVKVRNIKALHNEFLNELGVFQTEINKLRDLLKKLWRKLNTLSFQWLKMMFSSSKWVLTIARWWRIFFYTSLISDLTAV